MMGERTMHNVFEYLGANAIRKVFKPCILGKNLTNLHSNQV